MGDHVCGPFLRLEGVMVPSRTLGGLKDTVSAPYAHDKMQPALPAGYQTDISHDLGPCVNADRDEFMPIAARRNSARRVKTAGSADPGGEVTGP